MKRTPVRSRSRAFRVLLVYFGMLGALSMLMAADIWWLDAAYLSLVFALLLAFSVRSLVSRWRSEDQHDVTKYGVAAAYGQRWRRWVTDDYPDDNKPPDLT